MRLNNVFYGFAEAEPSFPPSYKYVRQLQAGPGTHSRLDRIAQAYGSASSATMQRGRALSMLPKRHSLGLARDKEERASGSSKAGKDKVLLTRTLTPTPTPTPTLALTPTPTPTPTLTLTLTLTRRGRLPRTARRLPRRRRCSTSPTDARTSCLRARGSAPLPRPTCRAPPAQPQQAVRPQQAAPRSPWGRRVPPSRRGESTTARRRACPRGVTACCGARRPARGV